jgi:hypothetical protein
VLKLFNGTFENSENAIARHRMKDVSLVGNGNRLHPDTAQWTEVDSATWLNFKTGEPGTWVAGLSTHPNKIELKAKDFNEYLEHDGVLDEVEWRKQNNALDEDAYEQYSKHVKAIFQVGGKKTDDWKTVLGYPIEFVPERNPYELKPGESLNVKLLWNGQPLPNQLVYAGSDGGGDHGHTHTHADAQGHEHKEGESHSHDATQLRTNAMGVVSVLLTNEGQWFLRTIHMAHPADAKLTHESNWATLTFELGHGHSQDSEHTHKDGTTHSHGGIPTWLYWVGGLAVLAGLFFLFRNMKYKGLRHS